jgi:hypothetical protein
VRAGFHDPSLREITEIDSCCLVSNIPHAVRKTDRVDLFTIRDETRRIAVPVLHEVFIRITLPGVVVPVMYIQAWRDHAWGDNPDDRQRIKPVQGIPANQNMERSWNTVIP